MLSGKKTKTGPLDAAVLNNNNNNDDDNKNDNYDNISQQCCQAKNQKLVL